METPWPAQGGRSRGERAAHLRQEGGGSGMEAAGAAPAWSTRTAAPGSGQKAPTSGRDSACVRLGKAKMRRLAPATSVWKSWKVETGKAAEVGPGARRGEVAYGQRGRRTRSWHLAHRQCTRGGTEQRSRLDRRRRNCSGPRGGRRTRARRRRGAQDGAGAVRASEDGGRK
jgi:hypothetical protein